MKGTSWLSHPTSNLSWVPKGYGVGILCFKESAQLLEEELLRVHWLCVNVYVLKNVAKAGPAESLFSSGWPWGPASESCPSSGWVSAGDSSPLRLLTSGLLHLRPCWAMSVTVSSSSQSGGSCTESAPSSSPSWGNLGLPGWARKTRAFVLRSNTLEFAFTFF